MSFARIYLRIVGAMTVVFGLVYLFAPESLTGPAGFAALAPGGLTDVRATYGGFQLGMGAFLLWAAGDVRRLAPALVLVALSIGAVGLSRAIGLVLDSSVNWFHGMGLVTEISLTALTLYAWAACAASRSASPPDARPGEGRSRERARRARVDDAHPPLGDPLGRLGEHRRHRHRMLFLTMTRLVSGEWLYQGLLRIFPLGSGEPAAECLEIGARCGPSPSRGSSATTTADASGPSRTAPSTRARAPRENCSAARRRAAASSW